MSPRDRIALERLDDPGELLPQTALGPPAEPLPRTLDVDLILHGTAIIDEPGLIVPHVRFREREFVLEPLAEIAPDLRDPVTGRTVLDLLTAVRESAKRQL